MYSQIPDTLKGIDRWVTVYNDRKFPMQSNVDRAASSVDPSTWSSFEDAVNAVMSGRRDGIGFVFNGDGIVGIDIDAGYDEDGLPSEVSVDCISSCRSYTEESRSGRGVHILLRGELPFPGRNNREGVEIYREGRYFIVTGRRLMFDQIVENQDAIDYIVGKYFQTEESDDEYGPRIYSPDWTPPDDQTLRLRPLYPPVGQGSRNVSLLSLAGHLRTCGYTNDEVEAELLIANERACVPPLSTEEVERIARSSRKYADKYSGAI